MRPTVGNAVIRERRWDLSQEQRRPAVHCSEPCQFRLGIRLAAARQLGVRQFLAHRRCLGVRQGGKDCGVEDLVDDVTIGVGNSCRFCGPVRGRSGLRTNGCWPWVSNRPEQLPIVASRAVQTASIRRSLGGLRNSAQSVCRRCSPVRWLWSELVMRQFDDVDQQVGLVRATPMDGCRIGCSLSRR
jgi:hypothetical protein